MPLSVSLQPRLWPDNPVVLRNKTMIKKFEANKARLRRHQRIRRHLIGTSARPRLNVFRSDNHIYAQVIDDTTGQTLVAASSLDESLRNFKPVESTNALAPKAQAVEISAPVAQVEEPTGAKGKKASKANNTKAPRKEIPRRKPPKPEIRNRRQRTQKSQKIRHPRRSRPSLSLVRPRPHH